MHLSPPAPKGTASFGDTLSVQLDTAAQQIRLRFVDSRFGLRGAIVSPYATDSNGQSVALSFQALAGSPLPAGLSSQLGLSNGLKDDPYRSLVYFTREVGYDKPVNPSEFLEFYWSEWLQAAPRSFRLGKYYLNSAGNGSDGAYMQAIKDASNLMLAANPAEMIGASGYSAAQMGQLSPFGTTAYKDPAEGKKDGKLAYSLEYRASLNSQK